MSCHDRQHSGVFSLARVTSGLPDPVCGSLFHALQAEGRELTGLQDPTLEQTRDVLRSFVERANTATTLTGTNLTAARRTSIISRLQHLIDHDTPQVNAATVYAWRRLSGRADQVAWALQEHAEAQAHNLGMTSGATYARLEEYMRAAVSDRSLDAPEGFTMSSVDERLPDMRVTRYALSRLQADAAEHVARTAEPVFTSDDFFRVQNSRTYVRAARNGVTGHVELERYDGTRQHYRAVSMNDYATIIRSQDADTEIANRIAGRPEHQYGSEEEGADHSIRYRCGGCGQFATPGGHACPVTTDTTTPATPARATRTRSTRTRSAVTTAATAPAPAGDSSTTPSIPVGDTTSSSAAQPPAMSPSPEALEIPAGGGVDDLDPALVDGPPLWRNDTLTELAGQPVPLRSSDLGSVADHLAGRPDRSAVVHAQLEPDLDTLTGGHFLAQVDEHGHLRLTPMSTSDADRGLRAVRCFCHQAQPCDHTMALQRTLHADVAGRLPAPTPTPAGQPPAHLQPRTTLAMDLTDRMHDAQGSIVTAPRQVIASTVAAEDIAWVQASTVSDDGHTTTGWYHAWNDPAAGGLQVHALSADTGMLARPPSCTCPLYQASGHCPHIDASTGRLAAAIIGQASDGPPPLPTAPDAPAPRRRRAAATRPDPVSLIDPVAPEPGTPAQRGNPSEVRHLIRHIYSPGAVGPSGQDTSYLHVLPRRQAMSAIANGGRLRFAVCHDGWATDDTGRRARFQARTEVVMTRVAQSPAAFTVAPVEGTSQCDCAQYRANGHCPHIDAAMDQQLRALDPSFRLRRSQNTSTGEAITAAPWSPETRHEAAVLATLQADAARARTMPAPAQAELSTYDTDMGSFIRDTQAARLRLDAGDRSVPLAPAGIVDEQTDGTRPAQFGIEIEYNLPAGANTHELNLSIGRALHAAGLTSVAGQQGYHSGGGVYSSSHAGGWKFERDGTVAGEIISPVCNDTEETWAAVSNVCRILREHGATATTGSVGGHVHVSTPGLGSDPMAVTRLARSFTDNTDVLYRVGSNPERGRHRPTSWSRPNLALGAPLNSGTRVGGYDGHGVGLNFQHLRGGDGDRVEFRLWDGSLDPGTIQTQVAMSQAMATAATTESGSWAPLGTAERPFGSQLGHHAARRTRDADVVGSPDWVADTSAFRGFASRLLRGRLASQATALFTANKWTAARG